MFLRFISFLLRGQPAQDASDFMAHGTICNVLAAPVFRLEIWTHFGVEKLNQRNWKSLPMFARLHDGEYAYFCENNDRRIRNLRPGGARNFRTPIQSPQKRSDEFAPFFEFENDSATGL